MQSQAGDWEARGGARVLDEASSEGGTEELSGTSQEFEGGTRLGTGSVVSKLMSQSLASGSEMIVFISSDSMTGLAAGSGLGTDVATLW